LVSFLTVESSILVILPIWLWFTHFIVSFDIFNELLTDVEFPLEFIFEYQFLTINNDYPIFDVLAVMLGLASNLKLSVEDIAW
jgi:hypothetical protein